MCVCFYYPINHGFQTYLSQNRFFKGLIMNLIKCTYDQSILIAFLFNFVILFNLTHPRKKLGMMIRNMSYFSLLNNFTKIFLTGKGLKQTQIRVQGRYIGRL